MNKHENPFLVSGYVGPDYFCNRQKETNLLQRNIKNNVNTTLFAIRRLGKTGLIHHTFSQYKNSNKLACIYVDILATKNLKEFTNRLATAVYKRFPENNGIGKKLLAIIKALRAVISYDALSGSPELSFEFSEIKQYEKTIQQLFSFLDAQKSKVVIAIDEFQQILEYPEKNTEALLRTHLQQLKNTTFIFCGSNQKMMNEIFNGVKRPFYASCSHLTLDFISASDYSRFIEKHFKLNHRKIESESVSCILDFTKQHTYYTQYLCNQLFASNKRKITLNEVHLTAQEILVQHESTYYQYRNLLTSAQWNLLMAIGKEDRVYRVHSKAFISNHKLGTSSMVTRGIEALLDKEMIYYNAGVAQPYYELYDKFLMRWLQHV